LLLILSVGTGTIASVKAEETIWTKGKSFFKKFLPTSKGEFNYKDSTYRNSELGFAITIPADWRIIPPAESIVCRTIQKKFIDDYFLTATPGNMSEALLVLNVMSLDVDNFSPQAWPEYVNTTVRGRPIKINEEVELNGLKIRRLGYEGDNFYREDVYFKAGSRMMEIYFYVMNSPLKDKTIEDFRTVVNKGLRAL